MLVAVRFAHSGTFEGVYYSASEDVSIDAGLAARLFGAGYIVYVDDPSPPPSPSRFITLAEFDAALGHVDLVIEQDPATGEWPLRSTVTTDVTRTVLWRGTDDPPSSTGYAIPGKDVGQKKVLV